MRCTRTATHDPRLRPPQNATVEDAADVVAETFLVAWRRLDTCRPAMRPACGCTEWRAESLPTSGEVSAAASAWRFGCSRTSLGTATASVEESGELEPVARAFARLRTRDREVLDSWPGRGSHRATCRSSSAVRSSRESAPASGARAVRAGAVPRGVKVRASRQAAGLIGGGAARTRPSDALVARLARSATRSSRANRVAGRTGANSSRSSSPRQLGRGAASRHRGGSPRLPLLGGGECQRPGARDRAGGRQLLRRVAGSRLAGPDRQRRGHRLRGDRRAVEDRRHDERPRPVPGLPQPPSDGGMDVRGRLRPTDVRGDPWAANARHSIEAFGDGSGEVE